MNTVQQDPNTLSFETALAELETIVKKLEAGAVPLRESIDLYERGAELQKRCEAELKAAELKVQQIVQTDSGSVDVQPMNVE